MTRSMSEPTVETAVSALGYRVRQLERRPTGSEALYEIKVFADDQTVATGDGKFIFAIPRGVAGGALFSAEAFVTTVSSSGLVTVMIRNVTGAVDMLLTAVTIDANEFTSYAATTPHVVDPDNDVVALGDRIAIDVDGAGTGAMGLGVILVFTTDL